MSLPAIEQNPAALVFDKTNPGRHNANRNSETPNLKGGGEEDKYARKQKSDSTLEDY
jgi:hypothetical protein